MKLETLTLALAALLALSACQPRAASSDEIANQLQETSLKDGVASVGAPGIVNWREKRLLKSIYELRDQEGLLTYTYLIAQNTGDQAFYCASVGYPISDATGFTGPDKVVRDSANTFGTVTQAEPNGLFTPDTSSGYWVMCLDEKSGKASPAFVTGPLAVSAYQH